MPVSHGEGRFLASDALIIRQLAENGQIATQYVDLDGRPAYDVRYNPNDSAFASRVLRPRMAVCLVRWGTRSVSAAASIKNVEGVYNMKNVRVRVQYFK